MKPFNEGSRSITLMSKKKVKILIKDFVKKKEILPYFLDNIKNFELKNIK
jgi:hypothetical protein